MTIYKLGEGVESTRTRNYESKWWTLRRILRKPRPSYWWYTLFRHPNIHKVTWLSPDRRPQNQIDLFAINRKWRSSFLDVRNRRRSDAHSDHYLLKPKTRAHSTQKFKCLPTKPQTDTWKRYAKRYQIHVQMIVLRENGISLAKLCNQMASAFSVTEIMIWRNGYLIPHG